MGTIGMATPEAALTKLVAMALLAPISETHHALAPAIWTFHRMEDWAEKNNNSKRVELMKCSLFWKNKPEDLSLFGLNLSKIISGSLWLNLCDALEETELNNQIAFKSAVMFYMPYMHFHECLSTVSL